jgi:hypothetical protein
MAFELMGKLEIWFQTYSETKHLMYSNLTVKTKRILFIYLEKRIFGCFSPSILFPQRKRQTNQNGPNLVAFPLPVRGSHPYWMQVDVTKAWPFRNGLMQDEAK